MYERGKLTFRKIAWTVLMLLGIIVPIILANLPQDPVEIVDDDGYILHYYESLNDTTCEIEVTFSTEIESGYITVVFFDADYQTLSTEKGFLYGYDTTLSCTFYSIPGKVAGYRILDYEVNVPNPYESALYALIFIDIIIFSIFIGTLLLSCKIYDFNGIEILVYAGWYHHYIKVNDVPVDEHNTLISFTPIVLSATLENGTVLQATISLTNRISLKINNKLYLKRKTT